MLGRGGEYGGKTNCGASVVGSVRREMSVGAVVYTGMLGRETVLVKSAMVDGGEFTSYPP